MFLWIESQRPFVIALLVFGVCYAIAAFTFATLATTSRHRLAVVLKATTPVMLTPLSVFAALFIAFLASRVWAQVDHANAYVAQEASALQQCALAAEGLPTELRTTVRVAIGEYIRFVETDDWPAMLEGRATLRHPPAGLIEGMAALLSFVPATSPQQLAVQRATIAIERILEARRYRLLLSRAAIEPIQWVVILILSGLVLLTVGIVHIGDLATAGLNLFLFATAVAACLFLLMMNDRPFSAGGFSMQPSAIRDAANIK